MSINAFNNPLDAVSPVNPPPGNIPPATENAESDQGVSALLVQSLQLQDKSSSKLTIEQSTSTSLEELTKDIGGGFVEIDAIKYKLEKLDETTKNSNSAQALADTVQGVISGIVLKGGASAAQSALPLLMHTKAELIPNLGTATLLINFVAEIIELGAGIGGSIRRSQILDLAFEELQRLKQEPLDDLQRARLDKLEKELRYENELWANKAIEQCEKGVRNIWACVKFVVTWAVHHPITKALIGGGDAIISGFASVLSGYFFYLAHEKLKAMKEWSAEFKTWVKTQAKVIKRNANKDPAVENQMIALRKGRDDRLKVQKENLLKKIERKELDMGTIQKRILNIKTSALHQFLDKLDFKNETFSGLKKKVDDEFGINIDKDASDVLFNAFHTFHEIKKQIAETPQENKQKLEELNVALNEAQAKIQEVEHWAIQQWIDNQSEDRLLSTYVDYHAILDPTIKNAMAEMVQKKHEIQKSFLKMKTTDLGLRFTVSAIIFGVALTLAILALAANPFAGAALIFTVLSVGSTLLGIGLMGAGYYHAYKQQPGLTAATLKGAYIRLGYFQVRMTLSSIKEKIVELGRKIAQKRRDLVDNIVQKLSPVSKLSSKEGYEETVVEKGIAEQKEADQLKKSQKQSEIWKAKADALEIELQEITWKDFADQAKLKVAAKETEFDTLETLNHLLTSCDFDLLSEDTKYLLENQLGINIHELQAKINENPNDPAIVKKLVRDFFNMHDDAFAVFTTKQQLVRPQQPQRAAMT